MKDRNNTGRNARLTGLRSHNTNVSTILPQTNRCPFGLRPDLDIDWMDRARAAFQESMQGKGPQTMPNSIIKQLQESGLSQQTDEDRFVVDGVHQWIESERAQRLPRSETKWPETTAELYGSRAENSLNSRVEPLAETEGKGYNGISFTNSIDRFLSEDTNRGDENDTVKPLDSTENTAQKTAYSSRNFRQALFFIRHPIAGLRIGDYIEDEFCTNITTVATRFASNIGLQTVENEARGTQVNAFRHTIWQAMITQEFGEKIASEAASVHEQNPFTNDGISDFSTISFATLEEADSSVDLLNNEIGRSIGNGFGGTTKDLAVAILNYYHENGLWVAVLKTNGEYQIVQYKLSDDEYRDSYDQIMQRNDYGFTEVEWAAAQSYYSDPYNFIH